MVRTGRVFLGPMLALGLMIISGGQPPAALATHGFSHATVKVWDTGAPLPPSISLGLTPGESVEDPMGLSGHGTSFPTIVTVYARSTHPLGPSGLSFWNPDGNVFLWYGKTLGFPSGIDLHHGGGPVLSGGPFGTSFGPGDIWVAGQQNEPLIVHMAGTDMFRSYGTDNPLLPPSGKVWGVEVDESTGMVFVAQPEEGRISRLTPPTGHVFMWVVGGSPAYVTVDLAGRPYATLTASGEGEIVRVNPGVDGVLGSIDDTATFWNVPGSANFRRVPPPLVVPEENPNGLITADANGNIWFVESNSNEIGRLSGGPDGIIGTEDDVICEFTKPGLLNPQQIAASGTGSALQVFFTEGEGNSVSVLTQVEADQAAAPTRVCNTVPARMLDVPKQEAVTRHFDEAVSPLRTAIVPTLHDVPGLDGAASGNTRDMAGNPIPPILRFSPMPNPLLSSDGTPIGDAGNGFPSGMTGVYATNRIAGAYLQGNKHFEMASGAIIAAPPTLPLPPGGLPGRMTGGGSVFTSDGKRVTHGLVVHCMPGQKKGQDVLQVNWEEGNRFHLETMMSASCSDDPTITPDPPAAGFDTYIGTGTGRYNSVAGATVEWTFTDAGEPGTEDTARIAIKDASGSTVLTVSGRLNRGNHQAHPAK